MNQYKCLLFDFGGVLVDWDGIAPLLELTDKALNPEQARRFWLESAWVREFESGRCTPEEFAQGAMTELHVTLASQDFIARFASWDKGPLPGARALLAALQPHFTLACLSNNNPIHWSKPELQMLLPFFQHRFVSFEIGCMKPDRAAFLHVVDRMPFRPEEILFFDDNPECVQGALAVGLAACQVKGVVGVQKALQALRIAI